MRRLAVAAGMGLGLALGGCSLLLDWDLSGGEAGGRDAGRDAPRGDALASCGTSAVCAPAEPSGWIGPVALYVGSSAPSCPESTPAFDGFSDLVAPPATCAPCACGPATGVSCAGPVVSFFTAPDCTDPTGSSLTLPSACSTGPTDAFGLKVAAPRPSGGSCTASGGAGTPVGATWGSLVRACTLVAASGECAGGGVCTNAPPEGFGAQPCVYQAGVASVCPAAFPSGPQVFYTGLDDTRACAACSCAPPAQGDCAIGSPAIDVYEFTPVCSGSPSSTLGVPSACQAFSGPSGSLKLVAQPALEDAGACGVADGGATGTATPSGATSFCCAP